MGGRKTGTCALLARGSTKNQLEGGVSLLLAALLLLLLLPPLLPLLALVPKQAGA